jgi:hypothetical protein
MTIDRARKSFHPSRDWRAVLAQQGRVTLEADINEQTEIAAELLRKETVDIIGPVGTPDGGYVLTTNGQDITVSAGTIYLAGLRLTLGKPVNTASQPGWLDMPAWPAPAGNNIIALLAIEQSVVAVEDNALLEVALGGPDSAGRLAVLQHFLRIPSTASLCADTGKAIAGAIARQGFHYDPATCEVTGTARLLVTPIEPGGTPGPCDPTTSGGYLGADNQMVRISITDYDSATSTGHFVWGYNNASFLYRATAGVGNSVVLLSDPIDPEHAPGPNQAVEILETTVDLQDGPAPHTAAGGNFIAAGSGPVMVLGSNPYASATRVLSLPQSPGLPNGKLPFFVRLWQNRLAFTAGVATPVDDIGLSVTFTDPITPAKGTRPFWQFAVRPSTPQFIYPQRYQTSPQPPEGPRQFLAALGIAGWSGKSFTILADCSVPFLPLTQLHDCDCCSLVMDPSKNWLSTLNAALNSTTIKSLSLCFQPGNFTVTSKIVFSGKNVQITGAGPGTYIYGRSLEAVFEFDNCAAVSLADFWIAAGRAGYLPSEGLRDLQGAVTMRNCNAIDINRVRFGCADDDMRSASCLAIYNPAPANPAPQSFNARILNSFFTPGHSQVGILVVNADRVQIEGNVVVTNPDSRNITPENLAQHKLVALRLRKQLLNGLTIVNTAPPATKKARARLRKREAKKGKVVAATKAEPAQAAPPAGAAAAAAAQPAAVKTPVKSVAVVPKINLGLLGRANVKAAFGAFHLSFISSEKLTNAWSDALKTSTLTATSTEGQIHRTVKQIAKAAVLNPAAASPALRGYINGLLPVLYSTSSQGIVVAGDLANDVRIINNTVDGTAQGIHVGLSDIKKDGKPARHRLATRVQIKGNTVNIRLTAEMTLDRHGIYLGCVTAGLVADNHLTLTRLAEAGQTIDGIKVAGFFGQSLLIERNNMQGFSTGIYTAQDATSPPDGVLWKIADNASDAANAITGNSMFITENNID